jgi:hypothetical protein
MWCLAKYYGKKMSGEVELLLHAFLTSVLDGDEWSASRPGRFILEERAPGTHWIDGWVGPSVCMEAIKKSKVVPVL